MPREVLDWLIERFPGAKRQTLRRMVQARRVMVNGRAARSVKDLLDERDEIEVSPAGATARQSLPFLVVHEDDDILVIDKPAGLLTSTVPREKRPTAVALVREYVATNEPRARVGLIHRLDRDASGLLIFSKNHAAYESLKRQFYEHSVRRRYTAVVHGVPTPKSGRIESKLIERADGSMRSTREPGKGQRAITEYETIRRVGKASLLRITLHTGRKHQIRVHLAERGVPVVNDPVYGKEKPNGPLMLAAVELEIAHPRTGKRMCFASRHSINIASP